MFPHRPRKTLTAGLCALLLTALAPSALAQESGNPLHRGFYGLIGATGTIDEGNAPIPSGAVDSIQGETDSRSLTFGAGYQINHRLAVELLGLGGRGSVRAPSGSGLQRQNYNYNMVWTLAVGSFPIAHRMTADLLGGIVETAVQMDVPGARWTRETSPVLGGGITWTANKLGFVVRLMREAHNAGDITDLSAALRVNF